MRNLTNQRFGRLVAIRPDLPWSRGTSRWLCRCDCGNEVSVERSSLIRGATKSCGCWRNERRRQGKHGLTYSPEWHAWRRAKERVVNPNAKGYRNYGGRGIQMSPEWVGDFAAFFEHIGPKPQPHENYSLDRINNDGHYEPGNVRWATRSIQMKNRRSRRRVASCHPERKHYAHGLCWPCYRADRRKRGLDT